MRTHVQSLLCAIGGVLRTMTKPVGAPTLEQLRPPRRWFEWAPTDAAEAVQPRLSGAARAFSACARAALEAAPGARLVVGGFSQGPPMMTPDDARG